LARLDQIGNVIITLLGISNDAGLADITQPRTAQKACERLFRTANFRTLTLLADVGGTRGQALNHGHQAARRTERLNPRRQKARLRQGVHQQLLEVLSTTLLHARRDFFGEKFEEELGH
jgi:hypothetical protein